MLEKGQVWPVYQDPFTEQIYEGPAKLVKKIGDAEPYDGKQYERWLVKFPGADDMGLRPVERKLRVM